MTQDSVGRFEPSNESLTAANVSSAARTATGTGTAFDTKNIDSINATLAITASSGTTPTLDLTLETTADGTNYYTAGTFPQQTGTATVARVVGDLGVTSRWKWTIGGTTPSFTFSVTSTVDRDN